MGGEWMYPDSAEAFKTRAVSPEDGDVLSDLYRNSPDTGEMGIAPHFKIDPYVAYTSMYPNAPTTGRLAFAPDGAPAGAGFVSLVPRRFGGEIRQAALLSGLAVHEEYRGQGLAKRLAAERIDHAEQQHENTVTYAIIQQGNEPSRAVAGTWAEDFPYRRASIALQPRDEEPETSEYRTRSIDETEYDTVAAAANEFYASAEAYQPYTVDRLRARLEHSPIDDPIADYVVAEHDGEIVGGAVVLNQHKLIWGKLEELPPRLQEAEELPPTIPESREFRSTSLSGLWYADAHPEAVDAIVETVRARPDVGNRIGISFDPESRFADLLDTDRETIEMDFAVRGLETPVEDSFVAGQV